ncbi:MAG: hypothetical protein ABSE71_00530 [Candidatus Micrarchaeaceae archaeon]|jgi:hypothetical protein|nr:hypothetical protein [Candidatus Micrarchaeota archaeon]HII09840.1 hypothetical protein [Candidatus Micrarchaeota archaeon]
MGKTFSKRLEVIIARNTVAGIDRALQGEMPLPVRQALIDIKLRQGHQIAVNTSIRGK